jgi:hypothetical protein
MKPSFRKAIILFVSISGLLLALFLGFVLFFLNYCTARLTTGALIFSAVLWVVLAFCVWQRQGKRLAKAKGARFLLGCTSIAFALFGVMGALFNWYVSYLPIVQTIPLSHGYRLIIYQDWDIGGNELRYSIGRPLVFADGRYLATISGSAPVPHFLSHVTSDGGVVWVAADVKPTQVVFLLDLSTGEYWPRSGGSGPDDWDWPRASKYLERINSDGGSRVFYRGQWRLSDREPAN